MKKILLVFLTLSIIGISITGCGGKSPEVVFKEFGSALQTKNWAKAKTHLENNGNQLFQESTNDEEGEKIAKLILSTTLFEVESSEATNNQATIKVKVTALDMVRIVGQTMREILSLAFTEALSGKSQENMDVMMNQYLQNSISDPQAPKTTIDTSVRLIKTKNGWKISEEGNEDFFNAITGNLAKAFAQ